MIAFIFSIQALQKYVQPFSSRHFHNLSEMKRYEKASVLFLSLAAFPYFPLQCHTEPVPKEQEAIKSVQSQGESQCRFRQILKSLKLLCFA